MVGDYSIGTGAATMAHGSNVTRAERCESVSIHLIWARRRFSMETAPKESRYGSRVVLTLYDLGLMAVLQGVRIQETMTTSFVRLDSGLRHDSSICRTRQRHLHPWLGGAAMLYVVVLLSLLVAPSAFAADELFLCEDGTYTNIAERMCPPYVPKGVVMTAPQGATFASVRSMFPEAEPKAAGFPDPVSVCNLYKEWQMLNLRTGGGVT